MTRADSREPCHWARCGLLVGAGVVALALVCACSSGSGDSEGDSCTGEVAATPLDTTDHPIVFASARDGTADLWLIKEDGSGAMKLTSDCPGDELLPSWSPDGAQIAYRGTNAEDANGDIFVMNADGTGQRQLTHTDDVNEMAPTWSHDGRRILYGVPRDDETGFTYVMNADGTHQRKLTDVIAMWASYSPDGERILYVGANETLDDMQIAVMDADGTGHTRLADDKVATPSEASWSPDGRLIAFVSPSGTYASKDPVVWNEDIFVMNADGTNVRRVTSTEGNDHWPPAWSPDNTHLVYTADGTPLDGRGGEDYNGELIMVNLKTGKKTPLTDHDSYDGFPDWRV